MAPSPSLIRMVRQLPPPRIFRTLCHCGVPFEKLHQSSTRQQSNFLGNLAEVNSHYTITKSPGKDRQISLTRPFTHWLNARFNEVDDERIKDVGYDRATAEWCLRVGASVKWVGKDDVMRDYNALPVGQFRSLLVEAIDGTDSGIMEIGFKHLVGLKHFNKMILRNCVYVGDPAMVSLTYNAQSLEWLEVANCGEVTDRGAKELALLKNLKYLKLEKLKHIKNPKEVLEYLRDALPNCEIEYQDAEESA